MPTILVIDDDDAVRGVIVTGLQKNRFKVLEASNGRDGIALARKEEPDLILCDLNLGDEDDASNFASLRKAANTAHVPLILMTGQPPEDYSGDELLLKPFTLIDLLDAIGRHLAPQSKKGASPQPKGNAGPKNESPPLSLSSVYPGPAGLRRLNLSREQLEELLSRAQSRRDTERTRLARAIHDDLTQTLTVVAIELSLLESTLTSARRPAAPAGSAAAVKRLAALVNDLIRSAQQITSELRPKLLDEFGLVAALEWLAQQVEKKSGVTCNFLIEGEEETIAPALRGELFRLSEEIVAHAVEDARASAIWIRAAYTPGELSLEIKDNGNGVGTSASVESAALGLLALRERAERVGGIFQVHRSLGKETAVVVRLSLTS